MNIINLTPHTIVVELEDSQQRSFESTGIVRCSVQNVIQEKVDGIPISTAEYGEIIGLPEPSEDKLYLTSAVVAQRANRRDVVGPDSGPSAIRENGQIIAVRGFIRY